MSEPVLLRVSVTHTQKSIESSPLTHIGVAHTHPHGIHMSSSHAPPAHSLTKAMFPHAGVSVGTVCPWPPPWPRWTPFLTTGRPRYRSVRRPRMAEHLKPFIEIVAGVSLLVRAELHFPFGPAAEMIQPRVGQSVFSQLEKSIVHRDQLVSEFLVMRQDLHLNIHATGMGRIEIEGFLDQLVIPPHHLEVTLQQMQQVELLGDGVLERYFIRVVQSADLTVLDSFEERRTRSSFHPYPPFASTRTEG